MKDIRLAGKKILTNDSPVVFSYIPDEKWRDYFDVKSGEWSYDNHSIIGKETGNKGGILFTKKYFTNDIMLRFRGSTILPATRDLNAVWAAHWDNKTDYLGKSYVCGLNGWWENKAGIERNDVNGFYSLTSAFRYEPGTEIEMLCGSVKGHCFMVVNDLLVTELHDPAPISGGHVGFSAYCTWLKINEIEIRKIKWEPFPQSYVPEF